MRPGNRIVYSSAGLDFLLTFSGCNIFTTSRFHRLFQILMYSLCLIRLSTAAYSDLMSAFERNFEVFHLSDMSFWVFCLAFYLILFPKIKSIRRFLMNTSCYLTESDIKRIRKSSVRMFGVALIYFVMYQMTLLCWHQPFFTCPWKLRHLFFQSNGTQDYTLFRSTVSHVIFMYESVLSNCWIIMCLSMYTFAHGVQSLAVLNLLQNIKYFRGDAMVSIEMIDKIQAQFDSIFSIFPFLVFVSNFFMTSGYLLAQFMAKTFSTLNISNITVWSLCFSVSIAFVLITCRFHEDYESAAESAIKLFSLSNKMSVKDLLVVESITRTCIKRREKGWKVFELDYSSFAVYVANIVNFAVLFIQISGLRGTGD